MIQPSEDALRTAQRYQRYRVPRLFAPWAEVLDFAEIREGKRVSVGGGVSAHARNPAMLSVARETAVPDASNIGGPHLPFGHSSFAAVSQRAASA